MKNKLKKIIDNKADQVKTSPMIAEKTISVVGELAETLCESLSLDLVHVEFQREPGGRILRVFIDKPGGAGLDDCVRVSRQLGDLLDVYLDADAIYNLEVSTPGPERPLGKVSDFDRFKGKIVKIRTRKPIDGQKNFTGKLLGITEGIVSLEKQDITVAIPHLEIAKARIVDNYGENECL